jgi:segregation and condensation protein A
LDAMRTAGDALYERPQTDLDIFVRGAPESVSVTEIPIWEATIWDLLQAYAAQRVRTTEVRHEVRAWPVYSLDEARKRLESLIPEAKDWSALGRFAPPQTAFKAEPPTPASRYASLMVASLELAKQGKLSVRQLDPTSPLFVKAGTYD